MLLSTLFPNALNVKYALSLRDQVAHPHRRSKVTAFFILIFKILERVWKYRF
jgi:hypothetical protein